MTRLTGHRDGYPRAVVWRGATRVADRRLLAHVGSDDRAVRAAAAVSAATRGGGLWHVTSLGLVLSRRRAAVRAAGAGEVAWAAASLAVALAKARAGRRRPSRPIGPPVHSSSMPSSHTASAVAYVTAATWQHGAAAPLVAPAALVAWSRLATRRHFPTDVAIGAAIGVVVGVAVGVAVRRATSRPGERSDG
jgi:undecaprenyl-diphosphatase